MLQFRKFQIKKTNKKKKIQTPKKKIAIAMAVRNNPLKEKNHLLLKEKEEIQNKVSR